jgi:hypothetical protein
MVGWCIGWPLICVYRSRKPRGKPAYPMAPFTASAVAMLLAVVTDAAPWRVAAAVAIAVSLAVVAVCLRRAG